jgi:hypothetical protein
LRRVDIEQIEVPEPPWFGIQNEFRSPRLRQVWLLWAREAVDVGPMMCNQFKVVEVSFDELSFVFGPNWVL